MTTYIVQTDSYCGMTLPHGEYDDYDEALRRFRDRIKYVEQEDCEVVELGKDLVEVCEPEDCNMVPDFCGILKIRVVEPKRSRWDYEDFEDNYSGEEEPEE